MDDTDRRRTPSAPAGCLADLLAGLAVAGLLLPEAIAYAGIAGLPPQRALVAAIVGGLVYLIAGRSRFAIVAPTSSSAAILAAALANLPGNPVEKAEAATLVVAFVGAFFLAASLTRVGNLSGFISRPVLKGFALGLAATIILRQVPLLLGLDVPPGDLLHHLAALAGSLGAASPASLATGLVALAVLLVLRRWRAVPAAFLVLVGSIAISAVLDLPSRGVATVGAIPLSLAWPTGLHVSQQALSHVAQLTLPLVLILFAESWGTMRTFALRHGDAVEPDREMRALGFANAASAAFGGMPVGAGFSAGALAEAAGARSRATSAVAALGLAVLLLAGRDALALLPEPVLAAVVIAAVGHALDPRPFLRLWRIDRDRLMGPAAAVGVVALGVVNGMLLAIALSVIALLRRLAQPIVMNLGRLPGSHDFVDRARHPDALPVPGLVIWRPAEPLFFGNADQVLGAVQAGSQGEPGVTAVVLSLEESFDLDSTALDALLEFDARLHSAGRTLYLARVRDAIRDLLVAAGETDLLSRCGYSVDNTVEMVEARLGGAG